MTFSHRTRSHSTMSRVGRLTALGLVAALPASAAVAALGPGHAAFAGQSSSLTFSYNDTTQYFVVPQGVYSLSFAVAGGDGGTGQIAFGSPASGGAGGDGATASGTIPVTPGDTLVVEVGGPGAYGGSSLSNSGGGGGLSSGDGMNGGPGGAGADDAVIDGGGGGGGGGGSELVNATASDTVIAAAGGGGGGGGAGASASNPLNGGAGGGAGGPGANAEGGASGGAGAAANSLVGGTGGAAEYVTVAGGAGGGGGGFYAPQDDDFGGGNGGAGGGWQTYGDGGGGGGSGASFVSPAASGVSFGTNTSQTAGYVTLTWVTPTATSTTLTSSPSRVDPGATYTLTATVTGTGTPGGTVTFTSSLGDQLTASLNGDNPDEASVNVTAPSSVGPVTWQAQYNGDTDDEASTSGLVTEQVFIPTTTTLNVAAKVTAGAKETVSATVTSEGDGPATGEVLFLLKGMEVGTGELTDGTASFTTTAPTAAGTVAWGAIYLGDPNHATSTATLVLQTVVAVPPTIRSLAPSSGPAGTVVTLTGAHLAGATEVLWGKASSSVTCSTATSCTAVAPAHPAGPVSVRIVGPNGESKKSSEAEFTYTN